MANHGPSYGLSRELEKKNLARFNIEEAREVLQWIELATGRQFDSDPSECDSSQEVSDVLKDGEALCILMNRIVGAPKKIGPVRYHTSPKMPFHKMENISNFLDACKSYGVPEISCFQTVDLYENKQPYKVIECLRALATVAQSRGAPIQFPPWVVKMSASARGGVGGGAAPNTTTTPPRRSHYPSPMECVDSTGRRKQPNPSDAIIPLQYGTNKCASQKGMTPYGLPRQIKPDSFNSSSSNGSGNGNGQLQTIGPAVNSSSCYVEEGMEAMGHQLGYASLASEKQNSHSSGSTTTNSNSRSSSSMLYEC